MCILQYLDPVYVHRTAFPDSSYVAFQKAFPASGTPRDAGTADDMLFDLRLHFSPIYDDKTWKLQLDEDGNRVSLGSVPEEWWALLENILIRPDIASMFVSHTL